MIKELLTDVSFDIANVRGRKVLCVFLKQTVIKLLTNRVRTDHNLDDTPAVLEAWCTAVRDVYLSVDCQHSKKVVFDVGYPPPDTDEQYRHTAGVQQTALEAGRRSGAQYFFVSFQGSILMLIVQFFCRNRF